MSEYCKSLVLQDKCNIEIFLSSAATFSRQKNIGKIRVKSNLCYYLFLIDGDFPSCLIHRGSNMSADVLSNLLNELGKRINARLVKHFISFSQ